MRRILLLLATLAACAATHAQSPAPVVIQAMTPGQTTLPRAATAQPAATGDSGAVLKVLLEMKAANEQVLQKQAATLQQLDDIEKAADQIKIYSKRG